MKRIRKPLLIVQLVLLVILGGVITDSGAAVLFSREPDFSLEGRFSNFEPAGRTFQRTANAFVLEDTLVLTDVHWFGYFERDVIDPSFRIRLFEDDGDLPGALVYEQEVTPDVMDTGFLDPLRGRPILEFGVDPLLEVELQAGITYWISIAHAPTVTQFLWSRATTNDGDNALRSDDNGQWVPGDSFPGDNDHAFSIIGRPMGPSHFVCYKIRRIKGEPKFEKREVIITNQFGKNRYIVMRPETLCVPSEKEEAEPRGQ